MCLCSGSIPSVILALPQVEYVSLSENCFSGSFPAISGSMTLRNLYMNALTSTSQGNCRKHPYAGFYEFIGFWQGGYYIADRDFKVNQGILGQLPSNLFSANPLLSTFQCDGNGIHSRIPEAGNDMLGTLSLSHNHLYGTIPQWIEDSTVLSQLDLSNNRLSGTMESMNSIYIVKRVDGENNSLVLSRNHLSGNVPPKYKEQYNISVLSGNSFQCDVYKTNIPIHDAGYDNISCGSDSLSNAYILNGLIGGILVLIVLGSWRLHETHKASLVAKLKNVYGDVEMSQPGGGIGGGGRTPSSGSGVSTAFVDKDRRGSVESRQSIMVTSSTVESQSVRMIVEMTKGDLKKDRWFYLSGMMSFVLRRNDLHTQWHVIPTKPTTVSVDRGQPVGVPVVNMERKEKGGDFTGMRLFFVAVGELRRFVLIISLISLLIYMPTYLGLKLSAGGSYSSHFYQYGWIISSLYLEGELPGIVLLLLWLCVFVLTIVYGRHIRNVILGIGKKVKPSYLAHVSKKLWLSRLKYLWRWVQIVVNVAVVLYANIFYLSTRADMDSPYTEFYAVVFIVSFNFVWKYAAIDLLILNGYVWFVLFYVCFVGYYCSFISSLTLLFVCVYVGITLTLNPRI